ncbi:cytochrome c biogenesis CcdA family protein [candidate division KSB1 bacterium]
MIADLTLGKITALALADAVNPCAIAVLTLVLVAILTADPKKKHKVLLGGFSFIAAVFILYLLYGIIIVQVFKSLAQSIATIRPYLYNAFAALAIIFGALNIRDYIRYRPGALGTEMPLFMRPKMKKVVSRITSPWGAFSIGAFVTIFLLPCTIGPYIIASGILSYLDFFKAIPWLLYYNLIFVLPMIAIVIIVYVGYSTVNRVSGWKDKHIRGLHLVAGIILVLLGIAMIVGWV